jgi:threonine/homoserine/homoserine lactone efflux protein
MTDETLTSLAAGTVFGLSAGLAPGPLLALVVTQTLQHGIREGAKVAMAPLLTDLPIILVSLLVLSRLSRFEPLLGVVSVLGGAYVLLLAYGSLRTGATNLVEPHDRPRSFRKGAMINALNPHPYLFWATVGGPFLLRNGEQGVAAPFLFLLAFYLFLVGSKVILAVLVGRSRTLLRKRGYAWSQRVMGCLLALFAALLLRDGLLSLGWLRR